MPITPNIIQTMKQTVKARVLTMSTARARLSLLLVLLFIVQSTLLAWADCRNQRFMAASVRRRRGAQQKDYAGRPGLILKN